MHAAVPGIGNCDYVYLHMPKIESPYLSFTFTQATSQATNSCCYLFVVSNLGLLFNQDRLLLPCNMHPEPKK